MSAAAATAAHATDDLTLDEAREIIALSAAALDKAASALRARAALRRLPNYTDRAATLAAAQELNEAAADARRAAGLPDPGGRE